MASWPPLEWFQNTFQPHTTFKDLKEPQKGLFFTIIFNYKRSQNFVQSLKIKAVIYRRNLCNRAETPLEFEQNFIFLCLSKQASILWLTAPKQNKIVESKFHVKCILFEHFRLQIKQRKLDILSVVAYRYKFSLRSFTYRRYQICLLSIKTSEKTSITEISLLSRK